jgi:hypothetical protein
MTRALLSALHKCARRSPNDSVTLTDDEVRELLSDLDRRAYARGRDDERADVVAWMCRVWRPHHFVVRNVAPRIESCEHDGAVDKAKRGSA